MKCLKDESLVADLRNSISLKNKNVRSNSNSKKRKNVDKSSSSRLEKNAQQEAKKDYDLVKDSIVESVLGATDVDGELFFLVKLKDKDEALLISSKNARKICPNVVISYLETKIKK